jgi:hypothetical protein
MSEFVASSTSKVEIMHLKNILSLNIFYVHMGKTRMKHATVGFLTAPLSRMVEFPHSSWSSELAAPDVCLWGLNFHFSIGKCFSKCETCITSWLGGPWDNLGKLCSKIISYTCDTYLILPHMFTRRIFSEEYKL